ncbi:RNA-dependent RNA polymerase [Fusarium poae fusarivirus 2]|nr:RNA-dependent RNA polymerase [Fusarium poae fusarivirus 2]
MLMCFCVFFMGKQELVSSVPFLVFCLVSPFLTPWGTLWVSGMLPGFISVLMLLGVFTARGFVNREAQLVRQFGPEHALWVDSESWFSLRRHASVVVAGIDPLLGCPSEDIILSSLRKVNGTHKLSGWYENSSLLWSSCILYAKTLMNFSPTLWYAIGAFVFSHAFKPVKSLMENLQRAVKWGVYVVLLLATVSTSSLVSFVMVTSAVLSSLWHANFGGWYYRVKLELTILVVEAVNVWLEFNFTGIKWFSQEGFKVRKGVTGKAYLADSLSKLGIVIADLGLPNYILSKQPQSYSAEDINSSLSVMKDLGWPINVELASPSRFASSSAYADWLVAGSSWQQGLHQRQMYADQILDPLRIKAVEFCRAPEYMSLENELESIARYFKSPRYDFPDLPLDDVWFLIGDIFKFSRLAPFNHIIRLWEKKYALGSFMVDPANPRKKYSRWKFISTIGYKSFKELWRKTFEVASLITPVAHVSVKGEALPPKKFLADKVRTVVGSPLGQYILSTVFNFYPNHNFRFESTPIKVGMPLNGFWFNKVYDRHSRCQVHFAGDFSDFDSTLSGNVREIIKAVRKRGFSSHKDVDRICKLIDLNYDQVNNQLLNTTSTGDIYGKGTGLTTGHSSTTMDNSIGSIVLYLMAWRELTGMDAQAFKHYVELDVFGDDHIISWLATSPVAWNFPNIQQVMSKWGLELREEASGKLENLPFLSKYVRRPNPTDVAEMKAAGVWSHGSWVVFHDKTRLLGKLVSKVKTMAPEYRLKRLLSYLSLTAHHKDVYDQLVTIITRTNSFAGILRSHRFSIPSYGKVLQDWYTSNAVEPHQEMDEIDPSMINAGLVSYGSVSIFDSVLGVLAQVPDIINPVLFNFGYLRAFQARGAHLFDWPFQLLEHTNNVWGPGELAFLMQRSPYSFLDPTIRSGAGRSNLSTLMVRNFLFLQFKNAFRIPSLLVRLGSAHRKFAQVQFWLNGKVMDDVRSGELPIWQMVLVASLSLISLPDIFPWLADVSVPNIPLVIEKGFLSLSNFFWSSLPPNSADVVSYMESNAYAPGVKPSIAAPTGSGKSTALIKAISDHLPMNFSRVVVIEPRSAIVKGLVPYTQQQLALDSSGATSGMTLDTKAKVWYVTAQEALMHTKWWLWAPDTLFVMALVPHRWDSLLLSRVLVSKKMAITPYLPLHFVDTQYDKRPLANGTGYHNRRSHEMNIHALFSHPKEYESKRTSKGYYVNAFLESARSLIHWIKLYGNPFRHCPSDLAQSLREFFLQRPTMLFTRNHISDRDGILKQRPVYAVDDLFLTIESMLTFLLTSLIETRVFYEVGAVATPASPRRWPADPTAGEPGFDASVMVNPAEAANFEGWARRFSNFSPAWDMMDLAGVVERLAKAVAAQSVYGGVSTTNMRAGHPVSVVALGTLDSLYRARHSRVLRSSGLCPTQAAGFFGIEVCQVGAHVLAIQSNCFLYGGHSLQPRSSCLLNWGGKRILYGKGRGGHEQDWFWCERATASPRPFSWRNGFQ